MNDSPPEPTFIPMDAAPHIEPYAPPPGPLDGLIGRLAEHKGAHLSEPAIQALATLRLSDPPAYAQLRQKIKDTRVELRPMDKAVKEIVDAANRAAKSKAKADRRKAVAAGDDQQLPEINLTAGNFPEALENLRDALAASLYVFERGKPVYVGQEDDGAIIVPYTPFTMMKAAGDRCRMYKEGGNDGDPRAADLPLPLAKAYLDWDGNRRLRPLIGIATAPILTQGGGIRTHDGYDPVSGLWCEKMPDLTGLIPNRPTRADAEAALRFIRASFETFCFADSPTVRNKAGLALVDINQSPGADESGFLVALMTAVCRQSLWLAPGFQLTAAAFSGAGTGKGLLVRCISAIAFGRDPHAVTSGDKPEEFEKRIAAEMMTGRPMLFLDNLNGQQLKSNLLASVITERPASMRVLGFSEVVELNSSVFVVVTGNALTVSEDLARRFVTVELDAKTENPETRPFTGDLLGAMRTNRRELLAAVLVIWRWGQQCADLPAGRPLGSFSEWNPWVRDPLLALGCRDPTDRIAETKAKDTRRIAAGEIFDAWWECHGDRPVSISGLDARVTGIIDPQGRGRQFVQSLVANLVGTRIAGFVLASQRGSGKRPNTTYSLARHD
jgi:hypothetical protein